VRCALYIPLFDELANPALVARLCAEAEETGWHAVFVWDHLRWHEPVVDVADTQITLAAIASATERIRLGPMVTPLARRRPVKVARETATLDRLSNGRLTLGVGLGSDRFGSDYSITGEKLDERKRARMLDEALEILQAAWSGKLVKHRGEHYTVDSMRFLPRPVQRPGVPIWVAGFYGKPRPLRRAARSQGFFPVTSSTRTSSPRSPRLSPRSANRREETQPRPTTSSPPFRPGPTRRLTARRALPGGWSSSQPRGPRSTECAGSSVRARHHRRALGLTFLSADAGLLHPRACDNPTAVLMAFELDDTRSSRPGRTWLSQCPAETGVTQQQR
jgi:alkanesulfonate monooxygenase SsuD/methylene tetrahydromethanopterin reductase-like flavin-dependent oxidoreductase (luciferase family)